MSTFLKTVVVTTLIALTSSAAMAAQAGGGGRSGGGGSGGSSDPDPEIPYGCLVGGDCKPATPGITGAIKKPECNTVRVKEVAANGAERWVYRCEVQRAIN